ncbi:hypothetical protein MRX96_027745 [Rhipicephalus microplus]
MRKRGPAKQVYLEDDAKNKMPDFVPSTDSSSWVEGLELYYKANGTVEYFKKRVVLFKLCGEQTSENQRALVAPQKKPSEVELLNIIKILTQHIHHRSSELTWLLLFIISRNKTSLLTNPSKIMRQFCEPWRRTATLVT